MNCLVFSSPFSTYSWNFPFGFKMEPLGSSHSSKQSHATQKPIFCVKENVTEEQSFNVSFLKFDSLHQFRFHMCEHKFMKPPCHNYNYSDLVTGQILHFSKTILSYFLRSRCILIEHQEKFFRRKDNPSVHPCPGIISIQTQFQNTKPTIQRITHAECYLIIICFLKCQESFI